MLEQWRQFLRRPFVWVTLLLSLALNLVIWGVLLLNISPQEGLVVLHYTLSFGVDRIGEWQEAFLIPAFGILVLITNAVFAWYFYHRANIVSRFFLGITPLIQLLLLLSVIFIVIANLPTQI